METLRNWTCSNVYHLTLLTLAYIIGEIAHFLIVTTAREVSGCKQRVSYETVWLQGCKGHTLWR